MEFIREVRYEIRGNVAAQEQGNNASHLVSLLVSRESRAVSIVTLPWLADRVACSCQTSSIRLPSSVARLGLAGD